MVEILNNTTVENVPIMPAYSPSPTFHSLFSSEISIIPYPCLPPTFTCCPLQHFPLVDECIAVGVLWTSHLFDHVSLSPCPPARPPAFLQVDRSGPIPLLRFRDRESYAGNKTKEYDELAMRYLSYALYPLVAGYAIYSLAYETHKSWYSWILSSLTGCVYTFGEWGSTGVSEWTNKRGKVGVKKRGNQQVSEQVKDCMGATLVCNE